MLILKNIAWKNRQNWMLKNCNLKRPWVSCMSDSSLNFAWKLHQVPSFKRIHLSFAWNQHPFSTDKICSKPTGWWCKKQLTVAFAVLKNVHCFFTIECPLSNFLMPTEMFFDAHWLLKMPAGFFCWFCRDFQSDNHRQFHWHFPPFVSLKERHFSGKYSWAPPL